MVISGLATAHHLLQRLRQREARGQFLGDQVEQGHAVEGQHAGQAPAGHGPGEAPQVYPASAAMAEMNVNPSKAISRNRN